ncbi:hypothetical protein N566_01530 [Streptomycetaceae bacterium MP113-05]|nr:hypothetical protein N566_01530 [Streptomycetaceae bacterium MP113-05]
MTVTADPVTEIMEDAPDPIDQLSALEEAYGEPVRAQYVERGAFLPPQPDDQHMDAALEFCIQLRTAGFPLAGMGIGLRCGVKYERTQALLIPDFYVKHRRPTDLDEAYRRTHKGWYSIDLLALVGEVTSTNHETDTGPKYRTYAAAGVPVYVLLHRREGKAYAFSDPVSDPERGEPHYATKTEVEIGRPLPLPEPYPGLETAFLLEK